MLESTRIGLKVDVDTLRGTREGVPRLMALFKKLGLDATFYFSVGPDHTGRAMRRVFRKGFAQKVARTSVLKHYGLKTLLYGVLLPGPDIGRKRGRRDAPACATAASRWGCTPTIMCAGRTAWPMPPPPGRGAEFERGLAAFERVFGCLPESHAAAGWQMNAHGLELEREYGLRYASDTRGGPPFLPLLAQGVSTCPQLPTTLPTFDEVLGTGGIDESSIAEAIFRLSVADGAGLQVFTLHAELEGMRLLGAFESLLLKWREAGASITRMAQVHELAMQRPLPTRAVVMGEVAGRSGRLAVQAGSRPE